ncbi:MAG: MBL fold metallo-hydrolase [Micavibrio sp.]|nr:MBL fold metallo-hydrolase [Micavibrio sp.]
MGEPIMAGSLGVTILGCGGSAGVPAAGNYWGACDPNEPRNFRSRCSIVVQSDQTTLIVDTGPEFRMQVNRENINTVDAVLYSHYHGDHVDGIADLRTFRFRNKALVPIYANDETLEVFDRNFPHFVNAGDSIYPQILEPRLIEKNAYNKPMRVGDIDFIPFEQDHTTCKTLGYRFGDFAYSVDVLKIDEAGLRTLKGVKTWVVDSAGYKHDDNLVHINLKNIYEYNKIIGAQRVILTSLTLAMDYQTLLSELPDGYEPAYDGLRLTAAR